ncbi:uncharacterized protein LOC131947897 [Physella acuta]|uniref:uncharacterized protein LOC131947897 n=1 Tax=Physella acuta TaxID=109671 RepID=UPI0027DDC05E|nr:uncharacterized protein LOC131947897 [Physella acuta]
MPEERKYHLSDEELRQLNAINDPIVMRLAPAMIFMGMLMFIGIVGNSTVIFVFIYRVQKSVQRVLLIYLAVFDLLTCMLSMPFEIHDMLHYYTFQGEELCKSFRFVVIFFTLGSSCTLLAIAYFRYRTFCKPQGRAPSVKQAQWSFVLLVFGSAIFSWPAPILYGIRTKPTIVPNLCSQDCTFSDHFAGTMWPAVYTLCLFVAFVLEVIILSVFYTKILAVLRKHDSRINIAVGMNYLTSVEKEQSSPGKEVSTRTLKFNLENENNHSQLFSVVVEDDISKRAANQNAENLPENGSPSKVKMNENSGAAASMSDIFKVGVIRDFKIPLSGRRQSSETVPKVVKLLPNIPQENLKPPPPLGSTLETPNYPAVKASPTKQKPKRVSKNATRVVVAVSIAYILSYLPHLIYQVTKILVELDEQGPYMGVYNIIVRSFFLSSVINPIIYTVVRGEYREVMADFFSRCWQISRCKKPKTSVRYRPNNEETSSTARS